MSSARQPIRDYDLPYRNFTASASVNVYYIYYIYYEYYIYYIYHLYYIYHMNNVMW